MNGLPVEEVLEMQKRGESDADVILYLTKKGYTAAQISEALNQAKIKAAVYERKDNGITGLKPSILEGEEATEEAEAPSPEAAPEKQYEYAPAQASEAYGYEQPAIDTETIEEIAEEIVNEKWEEIRDRFSDLLEWKDYAERKLKDFEDRVKRAEAVLDSLQAAVIGKVQLYGQDIKNLGKEMQSLEGAFSKILSPLVTNVKELGRATERIKEKTARK